MVLPSLAQPMSPLPPPNEMGMMGGPGPSPMDIMSMLDNMTADTPSPKYPPGYKKPPKPEMAEVLRQADAAKQANQPYLDVVSDTYRRIRQLTAGYLTEDDKFAREHNRQVPYRDPALVDALNRFVSYLAGRPIAFNVEVYDPELYLDAQKIEDFCYYLRRHHERQWVKGLNASLRKAEAHDLAVYGALVSRRTLNLNNPRCPIRADLIDPATVFPVKGRVGDETDLEAVYHVYTTTARHAVSEWIHGDIPKKVKDALGDKLRGHGPEAEVDLVEYWDSWWCGTFILGTDVAIKPIAAHEYGCVPYIITYGPGGENMHTRNPERSYNPYSNFWDVGNSNDERVFKATGFLDPMKPLHDFIEGVGARATDGFIKGFNPPWKMVRSRLAQQTLEAPIPDNSAGGVTVFTGGEEDGEPVTFSGAPQETNMLMTMLGNAISSNRAMIASRDMPTQSNISGQTMSHAAEEGRELEALWVEALEIHRGRSATHDLKLYRNFGYQANYTSGERKAFYVPRRSPGPDEEPSFELTPEMIDNVDTDVESKSNKLRISEMMPMAQVAQMLGPKGLKVWENRDIADLFGKTDYDRTKSNIDTENLIEAAYELPEFKKLLIPAALRKAARAAQGNPEAQEEFLMMLQDWVDLIAEPQRQQMQMQAQGGGQPQPGAGGPPGLPPGQPQPGAGIAGGAGAPYAGNPMTAPGAQGAMVGRPPTGGPVPPPPGSARIA